MNNATMTTHPPKQEWTEGGPVRAVIESTEIERLETTSEARIGDPAAMGLFGFSLGTVCLAWVFAGWAPYPAGLIAVVPMLFVFAGVGQFIAGLYAFSRTNTWAGTAMCAYGANNVIVATYIWMRVGGLLPATPGNNLIMAIDLFCMGYISLALMAAALRMNIIYALIAGFLMAGYTLPGLQFLGLAREVGIIGGYCLLAASFFAFWAATATLINSANRRELIPMFSMRQVGS